jgi:hypothetical protein
MSDLILPSGPDSAPKASTPPGLALDIDPKGYQSKACPYQSGIWGGGATISKMDPLQGGVIQNVVTPHGHSYVRCHSVCVHFDPQLLKDGARSGCRKDAAITAQLEIAEILKRQAADLDNESQGASA